MVENYIFHMPKCQNQGKPQYANELIKRTLKATLVTNLKKKEWAM